MTQTRSQLTTLMSNKTLARVQQLRLNCYRKFTNPARGEHLSGRGGTSTEFADFRNYVPGDDIRNVDWNIFSRLRKPYIKQFHQEQELHVLIIVDASKSMDFQDKLARAKSLAATFAVMALFANERASVWSFGSNEHAPRRIGPFTGRARVRYLMESIESIQPQDDTPLELGVERIMKQHRGRGVALIISDFMTIGDLPRMFNALYSSGVQPFGLQVLSPAELDPELNGDSRLIDVENGMTLDVTGASRLLKMYHEYRLSFERKLADYCKARNGRSITINSQDPLEDVIFGQLMKQGWVK